MPFAFSRQSALSEKREKKEKKKGEWPRLERRAAVYGRLVLQLTQLPNWMALHKPDSPSALEGKHSECAHHDVWSGVQFDLRAKMEVSGEG